VRKNTLIVASATGAAAGPSMTIRIGPSAMPGSAFTTDANRSTPSRSGGARCTPVTTAKPSALPSANPMAADEKVDLAPRRNTPVRSGSVSVSITSVSGGQVSPASR
jgi:hypothetical protein